MKMAHAVDQMTDDELRSKLTEFGYPIMPVTHTTRATLAKKLRMLMENQQKLMNNADRRSLGKYSSGEETDDAESVRNQAKTPRRATMAAVPSTSMQPPRRHRSKTPTKVVAPPSDDTGSESDDIADQFTARQQERNSRRSKATTSVAESRKLTTQNQADDIVVISDNSELSVNSSHGYDVAPCSPPATADNGDLTDKYRPHELASPFEDGDAYEKLQQIRSRLRLPPSSKSPHHDAGASSTATANLNSSRSFRTMRSYVGGDHYTNDAGQVNGSDSETPFLSNFTRRLSQLNYKPSASVGFDAGGSISPRPDMPGFKSSMLHNRQSFTSGGSKWGSSRPSSYAVTEYQTIRQRFGIGYGRWRRWLSAWNLVLLAATLFFIFLIIFYLGLRSTGSSLPSSSSTVDDLANTPVVGAKEYVCSESDDDADKVENVTCINRTYESSCIALKTVLALEMNRMATEARCTFFGSSTGNVDGSISEYEAVKHIMNTCGVQEDQIFGDLQSIEVLSFYFPNWHIKIKVVEEDGSIPLVIGNMRDLDRKLWPLPSKNVYLHIDENYVHLSWFCYVSNKILKLFRFIVYVAVTVALMAACVYAWKWWRHVASMQKKEEMQLIEKIIHMLENHSSLQRNATDGDFMVINHIRDSLLPIQDRKRMEKAWVRAMQYINENESRVRTEVRMVCGEAVEVWRWLGPVRRSLSASASSSPSPHSMTAASASPPLLLSPASSNATVPPPIVNNNRCLSNTDLNNCWQGQAFETQMGSPNGLPFSPTSCLKIRGMIPDGRPVDTETNEYIKQAVLRKCASLCRLLHCEIDTRMRCVYLRCAETSDAAIAYQNLHGWWYNGNLVTVKYIRLERYLQRFPNSPSTGPYLKCQTIG